MQFKKRKPHYEHLKKKWKARHSEIQKNLWEKHKSALQWVTNNSKQLVVGSLGGLMLLTAPAAIAVPQPHSIIEQGKNIIENKNNNLAAELSPILPNQVQSLSAEEEQKIGNLLSNKLGLKVTAELNGKRLNRSYGLIGAEQHLYRYPGDSLPLHAETEEDQKYIPSGIAPGLGAWGYFAHSQGQFTDKEKMEEKYYIAVQTFLCPDFLQKTKECTDFFRYRKMLVVNPNNGKAVVAVIGDAGPAEWTGKHLGGSPEVMSYLERYDGKQRGPVIYMFIDDPQDKIPLGPIKI